MKYITIITVCYNAKNTIKTTLDSIFMQKDINKIEYIIVDGGSDDGTVDVIQKYKETFNFKFVSERDDGIYDAMNKGVLMATGEYIFFLNSGDIFVDDLVITDVVNFLNDDKEIIYGDVIEDIYGKKVVIKSNKIKITRNSFCRGYMICHQCIFIKSNILKRYMFDIKYKICSDKDLLIRLYKNNHKFYYINRVISIYNRDGVSSQNTNLLKKENKEILYKHYYLYARVMYFMKKLKSAIKTNLKEKKFAKN